MNHQKLSVPTLHIHYQSQYPNIPSWSVNFEYMALIGGEPTVANATKEFGTLEEAVAWMDANLVRERTA